MGHEDTPAAQKAIDPARTPVRMPIERWLAWTSGVLIAGAMVGNWMTSVHRDVRELRAWSRKADAWMAEAGKVLGIRAPIASLADDPEDQP